MLYIISGTSRSGKTIIAKELIAAKSIPYISLDWLVIGFTNGIPEYGIHDKLYPDEIAKRFWYFLKAMCENMLWSEANYILEGEAVLPELIIELLEKYPEQIKICFVGYSDVIINEKVKRIKQYSKGNDDWLTNEPDKYIKRYIRNMIIHSNNIKSSCEVYNISYFDTSKNFIESINKAKTYLMT